MNGKNSSAGYMNAFFTSNMASNKIEKKDVRDMVVKGFAAKYPNITNFVAILLMDADIEVKQVGEQFDYPTNSSSWHNVQYASVLRLFIRKVLAQKYKQYLEDDYTDDILENVGTFFTPVVRKIVSSKTLEEKYKIFKDPTKQAMDIIDSIKIISLSKIIYSRKFLFSRRMVDTNNENLLEIKKYLEYLPYTDIEVRHDVDCEYFKGKAEIIFDKNVMCDIKTTKYSFIEGPKHRSKVMKKLKKLLLCSFGYYKKTGRIVKKFKIYNPLLSQELTLNLSDIDMVHFEEAFDKDITVDETERRALKENVVNLLLNQINYS